MVNYYIAAVVISILTIVFVQGYKLGTRAMSKYVNYKIDKIFSDRFPEDDMPETLSIKDNPEIVKDILNLVTEIRNNG